MPDNSIKFIQFSVRHQIKFLRAFNLIGFVVLGCWLFEIAPTQRRFNETTVIAAAIAGIVFFGMCGMYNLVKLFDRKPGLVITREGIQDNTSAISGYPIKWQHVVGLEEIEIQGTRILLIHVDNCNEILNTVGTWRRFWMELSVQWYGTPVSLTAGSLKCSFDELKETIEKEFDKNTNAPHRALPPVARPTA